MARHEFPYLAGLGVSFLSSYLQLGNPLLPAPYPTGWPRRPVVGAPQAQEAPPDGT